MNKELQQKLYTKYPQIFKEGSKTIYESAMGRGICCDDGWYEVLDELCQLLQTVYDDTGVLTVARQVKEKFGTMRFYVGFQNTAKIPDDRFQVYCELMNNTVDTYCNKTANICEICGKDGELRNDLAWIRCMCDDHYKLTKQELLLKEHST